MGVKITLESRLADVLSRTHPRLLADALAALAATPSEETTGPDLLALQYPWPIEFGSREAAGWNRAFETMRAALASPPSEEATCPSCGQSSGHAMGCLISPLPDDAPPSEEATGLPTAEQQERAKWRANERADELAEAARDLLAYIDREFGINTNDPIVSRLHTLVAARLTTSEPVNESPERRAERAKGWPMPDHHDEMGG
jgi:hypothetical protein